TPPLPVLGENSHAHLSPDGRRLLVVGDGSARLWEVDTGQPLTPPWPVPSPAVALEARRDPRLLLLAAGHAGERWELPGPAGAPGAASGTGPPPTSTAPSASGAPRPGCGWSAPWCACGGTTGTAAARTSPPCSSRWGTCGRAHPG